MVRALALVLTVFTGFSGLAYEVAWEKYLATLLGSHGEATASVLGIFLGGLAVGYWLFGVVTRRVVERAEARGEAPRLLLLYGFLEAGIGVYVLAFPQLFLGAQELSVWLPRTSPAVDFALDVVLSALLIGPPTILMGGTIPILTQALARSLEDATRFHAFVYAFNTAGAFLGALAAGFVLIPMLGLPRLMLAMGSINLIAGTIFVLVGLRSRAVVPLEPHPDGARRVPGFASYAAAALCVGFAMMAIQTCLVRLGALSFGASQFTFSMVVALFVLCIALGSFLVSALQVIPRFVLPGVLWALTALLLLLYGPLQNLPYAAHVIRTLFRDTDAAFHPYYLTSLLALLLLVGVPVVLSGATLPLLFHQLRREVESLGANAGRLYSWNTVGSFLGALLGGYWLLFWLDLHHVYRIAVAAVALGSVLVTLRVFELGRPVGAILMAAVAGSLLLLEPWEPNRLAGGLFRLRQPLLHSYSGPDELFAHRWSKIIFYDDDPTSSVAVRELGSTEEELSRSLVNNGKSDGNTVSDYVTTSLLALLPALFADRSERALVVGYGTGITAGEFAAIESMREVEVAEISTGVIRAAPLFDFANQNASQSPKVRIVAGDAYRVLHRSPETYDVIASEPSNPWVTGVEMLYSRQFLVAARERLTPGGVYAQWMHEYETDEETLALVLRTYASVFDHVSVWFAQDADLILLAFRDAAAALDLERLERRLEQPDFAAVLRRAEIPGLPALLAHELLPVGVLHAASLEGPIHTLHRPRLSYQASRAFFRGARGRLPFTGFGATARLGMRHSLLVRYAERFGGAFPEDVRASVVREVCRHRTRDCATSLAQWMAEVPDSQALKRQLAALRNEGREPHRDHLRELSLLYDASEATASPVRPADGRRLNQLFVNHYLHRASFDPGALRAVWRRCRAPREAPRACEAGRAAARALLAGRTQSPPEVPEDGEEKTGVDG